jgi:outer membrane receptor protein involved in Fe transport
MKSIKLLLVSFLLSLANLSYAEAEAIGAIESPQESKVGQLEKIVVTASRSDARLEQMPQYTSIITREDIEKSPAQSIDQLLKNIPGMNIAGSPYFNNDPTGQNLKMRGLTNAKVLVLLDGVPIMDPFYSTIQWAKVPLSSVDRVEIIRGGGSALWGNLAVAGVVNIISKKPMDDKAEIGVSYGSFSTKKTDVSKNLVISDALKIRVSADYMDTDGYNPLPNYWRGSSTFLPIPGQVNFTNQDTQRNVRLDTYFKVSEDTSGFFKAGYHDQDQYLKLATGANLYSSYDFSGGLTQNYGTDKKFQARAWYQNVSFDKSNAGGCYIEPSKCNASGVANPTYPAVYNYVSSHDDNPYTELGSSWMFSKEFQNLSSLQFGLDTRRIKAEDTQISYSTPSITDFSQTITGRSYGRTTQQFYGIFAQYKVTPFQGPVEITLNARQDYWRNMDSISQVTSSSGNVTGGAKPFKSDNGFNPSAAIRYDFNDNLSFRGSAYDAFRTPGLNNTYRSYGNTTSVSFSNADLAPEKLKGFELGTDYKNSLFSLSGTYFNYEISGLNYSYTVGKYQRNPSSGTGYSSGADATTIQQLCGGDPTQSGYTGVCPGQTSVGGNTISYYTDGVTSKGSGLELSNRWNLSENLKLDLGYVYTDVFLSKKLSIVTDPINSQLGGVPRNVAMLGMDWKISPKLRTYVQVRASGSSYADTAHTMQEPGYMTVDVSATYNYDKNLTINASIINLFDKDYVDNQANSATSLNYGLPFFASVGARYQF